MDSGYLPESYVKRHEALDGAYRSLYFLNRSLTAGEAKEKAQRLLNDPDCGNVFRVKGFVNDGGWMQLNATKKILSLTPIAQGQEVIIVIGEELNEERIRGRRGKDHHPLGTRNCGMPVHLGGTRDAEE